MEKGKILEQNKEGNSKDEWVDFVMNKSVLSAIFFGSMAFGFLCVFNSIFNQHLLDLVSLYFIGGCGFWLGMYKSTKNKIAFIPIGVFGFVGIVTLVIHIILVVK